MDNKIRFSDDEPQPQYQDDMPESEGHMVPTEKLMAIKEAIKAGDSDGALALVDECLGGYQDQGTPEGSESEPQKGRIKISFS